MSDGSKIFSAYRGLGLVSNGVQIFQKYNKVEKETYVYTVVGSAFHAYSSSKLRIVGVSKLHNKPITCITGAGIYTYVASGNIVYCWRRVTELVNRYGPHNGGIHQMLLLGSQLMTVDCANVLRVFNVESEDLYLELEFSDKFQISCIYHPLGKNFINLIVIGGSNGKLQLWNLKTVKLVYDFPKFDAKIMVIEQSPAVDVVAIGLENGQILLHNLYYDETIVKFQQDWGAVTSLSFRTDGFPIMVSGSERGHIGLWDLESKKISTWLENAHSEPVTGLECLQNQQLMITSSADNSLKLWIFDLPEGGARLYKSRDGHSAPPLVAKFYGENGENVITSGEDCTVRMFSTVTDILNHSLGRAVINRKALKRTSFDSIKMPPIIGFTSETTTKQRWANLAALHRGCTTVSTWSTKNSKMGDLKLIHERFKHKSLKGTPATAVEATVCGNFVIIGYDSGHLDKFNLESGIHRGSFGSPLAHTNTITGIVTDSINTLVVSGDQSGILKRWKFKNHTQLGSLQLSGSLRKMVLHRSSGLIGCSLDDWNIAVVDLDTISVVRSLRAHLDQVTDITFTQDARWLISSSDDRTLRTWDIPSGKCIDCLLLPTAASSVTMSPRGDFLATVHSGHLGVYLWSNRACWGHVDLRPLPDDFDPVVAALPGSTLDSISELTEDTKTDMTDDDFVDQDYQSPEQISEDLVTLAGLPSSRWLNLLDIETIRQRNKPSEPAVKPKDAPFFIPTVAGLDFRYAQPDEGDDTPISKIKPLMVFEDLSEIGNHLVAGEFEIAMQEFMQLTPSSIDVEIRNMDPDVGGSRLVQIGFMKMAIFMLKKKQYTEVVTSYLTVFQKYHSDFLIKDEEGSQLNRDSGKHLNNAWEAVNQKIQICMSLLLNLKK